jgi:hypothetical protein
LNGKWGFIDTKGNEIVPPKYDLLYNFYENFAIYELNEKHGFIDSIGNEIITPKYDFLWNFENGFARYEIKNKYGLIDKNGNELIKPLFVWDDIKNIHHNSNNIFWGDENIIFKNYSIYQNKMKIIL